MSYKNTDRLTNSIIDLLLVELEKILANKDCEGIIIMVEFEHQGMFWFWENLYDEVYTENFLKALESLENRFSKIVAKKSVAIYRWGCFRPYIYVGLKKHLSPRDSGRPDKDWAIYSEKSQEKIKEFDLNSWYDSVIHKALREMLADHLQG